jgi:D-glycero-D-manno-heptose 1,7-bisphosphate phosphatase
MNKAIFLDRDGVINKNAAEHDYIKSWNDFVLLEGVIETLKIFHQLGYLVVVVTNQAGVSKGLMSETTVKEIHSNLNKLLSKNGTKVDYFYYCPHKEQDKCDCRKPKTGMIRRAVSDLDIDLKSSILIGDSDMDFNLGIKANLNTILVPTNGNLYKSIKGMGKYTYKAKV